MAQGQRDGERRAAVRRAVDGDRAPVQAHQLAHHRQPDSAALTRSRPRPLHAVEPLEQARQLVGRDAGAGVGDRQLRRAPVGAQPDPDAALEGELHGVGQQVEDDLLPHVPVDVDRLGQRRDVHVVLDAHPLHRRAEDAGQLGGVRGQVDRLEVGLHPARLQPGEVEQGVDQLAEPQRVAVDDVELLAQPRVRHDGGRGAQLGDRAHDQRQRGAELVADVGEEVGLGPVQLGERLGPLPLGLVGQRIRDRGGELVGHQVEERAVVAVERPVRVHPGHEHAGRLGPAGDREGRDDGVGRDRRPGGGRLDLVRGVADQAADDLGRAVVGDPPQRLGIGRTADGPGGHGAAGRHTARRDEPQASVGRAQVGRHERDVGAVPREHADHRPARLLRGAGRHRRELTDVAQHAQPPLPDHPARRLGDGDEDPADPAALVLDRRVGEGPVRLLQVAVAAEEQLLVLGVGGPPAGEHRCGHRAELVPRLGPDLRRGPPESGGVLVAHGRDVGVVVEDREVRAPPDVQREPRRQADRQRRLQALRPPRRGADRGARPVADADALRHPAGTRAGPPRRVAHPLPLLPDRVRTCPLHFLGCIFAVHDSPRDPGHEIGAVRVCSRGASQVAHAQVPQ